MSSFASYRDLQVWQKSMRLALLTYELCKHFPKDELYGLTSQIRRSAISVPSNIAEGHARNSSKEFLRYLSISVGSLAELETQILLSRELTYLNTDDSATLLNKADEVGKMIRGLQKSIKTKLVSNPKPLASDKENAA